MERCNINYEIRFFSDWHCGSGLSAGADVDAVVVKDGNGLPYVPGKTIKGLIKEAYNQFNKYIPNIKSHLVNEIFDNGNKEEIVVFFSNAELSELTKEQIVKDRLVQFLYRKLSSTEINENGTAKKGSLRKTEVVIPCSLKGQILNIPKEYAENIAKAVSLIKRMGFNRNRGFGRCEIRIIDNY